MGRWSPSLIGTGAAFLGLVASAAAGEPAQTAVQLRDGYARFIVVTPEKMDFDAVIDEGGLRISFEKALQGDFLIPVAEAPEFFLSATHPENTDSLHFKVPAGAQLHTSQSLNVMAFDVIAPGGNATPTNIISYREMERARIAAFFSDRSPSLKSAAKPVPSAPLIMHLAPVAPEPLEDEALRALSATLQTWRARAKTSGFEASEEGLLSAIAVAEGAKKISARADLVYFYFAHELFLEAASAIDNIEPGHRDPEVAFIAGVASARLNRWDDALTAFDDQILRELDDARQWRAIASYRLGRFEAAAETFSDGRAAPPLGAGAEDFFLTRAALALRLGRAETARAALSSLKGRALTSAQRDARELLEAEQMMRGANPQRALGILARLQDEADGPTAQTAALTLLRRQWTAKEIDQDTLDRRLDRLALTWSGGLLEQDILAFRSEIYRSAGRIADLLAVNRELMARHPRSDAATAALASTRSAMMRIFHDSSIAPMEAARLFYENIDYAPPGLEGDRLIEAGAKTLVELDLLDEAVELLRHQALNRLRGAERARVGAMLAQTHLSKREPENALSALNQTRFARVSPALGRARSMIAARAHFEQVDHEATIAALGDLTDAEALLIKGRSYERAGEPEGAAAAFGAILSMHDGDTLDQREEEAALRLAAVYAVMGKDDAARRLREEFEPRFGEGTARALFEAMSREPDEGRADDLNTAYRAYFLTGASGAP